MSSKDEFTESLGAQTRLRAEISKLESESRGVRFLIIFVAVVLGFEALSLLLPNSFRHLNTLEIRIPPHLLLMVILVALVLSIYLLRHESELRKLRLLTLQQVLAAQTEHSASMFDAVTNVFTRRFLRELLNREIARAERNHQPLALIMCDVNHFKQVNDRYGHLMGDDVLAQIAGILKSCVRGSDHVVRYGGDEFLLILQETDDPGAQIVRGRIQEKVAEWDRSHGMADVSLSMSMGLYLHVPGDSAERDIAQADLRMYAEKLAASPHSPAAAHAPKTAVESATATPDK